MPPNQWRFSSPRTKPQPEVSPANRASSCRLNVSGPLTGDQFPQSLSGSPFTQSGGLWHFSSLANPSSSEPGYSQAFLAGQLVPEPQPDGKCESLLSLLPQDRCPARPQESATREDCNPVQIAGSTGLLLNLPPSSVHYKKIYLSPNRGRASTSLAKERSQSPERRKDLFFY
nr:transcription cofactor vestigial-like protein 1 isoform X3 [Microcebus murinus]